MKSSLTVECQKLDEALLSLALPIFPALTDEQQRYVVQQIDAFYAGSPQN
jgi:dTDP-4-amino-4,6-dideoxygalactose transaminase